MGKKDYHSNAKRFFGEDSGERKTYDYRILTDSLAEISSKECLFWTIEIIKDKLESFEQDDLSARTIQELEKIKDDHSIDAAKVFDELSFKNWRSRHNEIGEVSVHLPLARISWACLSFICIENNYGFISEYRTGNNVYEEMIPNLYKKVGWECGNTLDILFEYDGRIAKKSMEFYLKLIDKIEDN